MYIPWRTVCAFTREDLIKDSLSDMTPVNTRGGLTQEYMLKKKENPKLITLSMKSASGTICKVENNIFVVSFQRHPDCQVVIAHFCFPLLAHL